MNSQVFNNAYFLSYIVMSGSLCQKVSNWRCTVINFYFPHNPILRFLCSSGWGSRLLLQLKQYWTYSVKTLPGPFEASMAFNFWAAAMARSFGSFFSCSFGSEGGGGGA